MEREKSFKEKTVLTLRTRLHSKRREMNKRNHSKRRLFLPQSKNKTSLLRIRRVLKNTQ